MYGGVLHQRRRSSRSVQEKGIDPLLSLKSFGNPLLPPNLKRLPLYGILSPPASPPRKLFVCGISSSTPLSPIPVFLLDPASIPFSMAPSLHSSPVKTIRERKIESPSGYKPCGTSKAMEALLNVISRVSPASHALNSHIQQTPVQTYSPRLTPHSIMSTSLNHETTHGLMDESNAETQCVSLSEEAPSSLTVQHSQLAEVCF